MESLRKSCAAHDRCMIRGFNIRVLISEQKITNTSSTSLSILTLFVILYCFEKLVTSDLDTILSVEYGKLHDTSSTALQPIPRAAMA